MGDEAMGAGLPSIATEVCGPAKDMIVDFENGQIVPSKIQSLFAKQ